MESPLGEDFWKSTNQKEELPVVAIFVNESGRNEQSLQRTYKDCSFRPDPLTNMAHTVAPQVTCF
jgi:hypothetical protein